MLEGKLFIVATPIGNLGDITMRALDTLRTVDLVLCEDTRETRKLLAHYDIKTPTTSYHQHTDAAKVREISDLLVAGKQLALVTDAGTPGISDPGNHLIATLVQQFSGDNNLNNITIVPIPGPAAVIAALSVSGFPTDKFLFLGFPPHKKGRQTFFKDLAASVHTVAFYESNHRIEKCLTELATVLETNRHMCIARELTKKFETIYRGTVAEVSTKKIPPKGEFVVIVAPPKF